MTPDTTDHSWPCLRLEGSPPNQRLVLDISVSPNARKTELQGWHDGALRVRLAAPPVDGAANEALRRWLAQELGLGTNRVELVRGATHRRKQWAIDAPLSQITGWLAQQAVLRNRVSGC